MPDITQKEVMLFEIKKNNYIMVSFLCRVDIGHVFFTRMDGSKQDCRTGQHFNES